MSGGQLWDALWNGFVDGLTLAWELITNPLDVKNIIRRYLSD